ncbi:blue copper protein-like [Gossypium australe]|uniref:Blue copper protein-like n=1 Tax=Gossypium australe TaxID=47621 RepID=A0A5B6X3B7_9ROSI|nr:blue copper protein-like [Gossypium australe]
MASNKLVMLTIVAIFLPAMALATDYIVGDDSGWTTGFDYQAWAKDKVFRVGDKLVFQYPKGYHNVFKVNGTGFKNCDIPPENQALTSGNDTIVLKTPGKKWYICGVASHCSMYAQKLTVFVQYPFGLAPAPAPTQPSVPATPAPAPRLPVTPSVPATPTQHWAPTPAPSMPTTPTQPWAPAPAPWAPTTPSVPATPSEPWAPGPAPWTPATPSVPTTPYI